MANICLPPKLVDSFKQGLISGKIDPGKLEKMTSDERRALFTDIVGEGNAKFVNSQFESKMILKNQQRGYLTWAKKLTGITPEARRDLISRIQRMDKFLDPEEERLFLKDLASTRLGIDVSAGEAKTLSKMSKQIQELEARRRPDGTFPSEDDRLAYGRAKVDMGGYISDLRNQAEKLSLKEQAAHPIKLLSKAAGVSKSIKASLDNSAIFRQGWKTLWTNPVIWQKNARQTFIDGVKTLGGRDVMREVQADIISRPNADKYKAMKLAIGNVEEELPSSLPEKVPLFGRAFKASEAAYTGFLYRQRADIADKYLEIAERSGVNIHDKKELEGIGLVINSLTGRGNLGRFENGGAPQTFNNIFFSIRFFKSNLDTLTAHGLGAQHGMTKFARKRAAINLVQIASGTAAVLAIADAVKPGSVEWDPRSSDFGKIRIGNTRFDVTGGMGSIVVLASQLIKQEKKSATTGVVKKLGDGYGSDTGVDVVVNFFSNKLSPAAGVVRDLVKQQDFNGDKPTVKGEAENLLVPIPITTPIEAAKDPNGANPLLALIADGLGIGANTYGMENRSTTKLSKSQQQFKDAVGKTRFEAANEMYEREYDAWLADHKQDLEDLPNEDRQATITAAKTKIQKSIYKRFDYTPPKTDQEAKKKRASLLESIH